MRILRLKHRVRWMVAATLLAVAVTDTGCNEFLTSTKYRSDPSNPKTAGPDNLFLAIQLNVAARMTDAIAQSVCIWMQACSGQQSPYLGWGRVRDRLR